MQRQQSGRQGVTCRRGRTVGTTRRLAFTLVELLVVIAIIGILIGLLLPAINAAREAGRRAQCQNNLKQLALGVLHYNDSMGVFPPAATWAKDDPSDISNGRDNWVIKILPYMEYNDLYKQFNHDKPISDNTVSALGISNSAARGRTVREMLCPSDPFNRKLFDGTTGGGTTKMGPNWARGNYAANGGLGFLENNPGDFTCSGGAKTKGWLAPQIRGIMGSGCALKTNQVTDGLSHTVLLGEIRAGLEPFDSRGVWAMSGACPSSLWATAYFIGDDYGPNCLTPKADDVLNCTQIESKHGGPNGLLSAWMPCSDDNSPNNWNNWQQTARSLHTGGIYAAMADGSVRWIDDLIQCSGSSWSVSGNSVTITNITVWECLMASGDGKDLKTE
jgi:prepilin-type N-terminal cleavage/methylation domain-containing protein